MPDLAENEAAPSIAKQKTKSKLLRVSLYVTAFGLVPLATLTSFAMFTEAMKPAPATSLVTSETVNASLGKATAITELQDWLQGDPSPLPGGRMISWDGFESREAPEPVREGDKQPTYVEEVHRFTLTDGVRLYDSQIMVLSDPISGAKSVSQPTLLPRPDSKLNDWSGEKPWFGYDSFTPSDDVVKGVERWASALTSGVPSKLKGEVVDPDKNRSYVPLTGIADAEVRQITAGYSPNPDIEGDERPDEIIARVEIAVRWVGQPELGPGETPAIVAFDVLIVDAQTGSPRVVSWGGVGEGPSLTPYSVALTGVALEDPADTEPDSDPEGDSEGEGEE